ncbi:MAG TPA: hypothetical protein VL424_07465, partial [Pararobbsia sp.]|nr:hypothetical protein [Pararobbsia sp.]
PGVGFVSGDPRVADCIRAFRQLAFREQHGRMHALACRHAGERANVSARVGAGTGARAMLGSMAWVLAFARRGPMAMRIAISLRYSLTDERVLLHTFA